MAEVTGPCSTLPGALHKVPEGTKCDDHADRDATHRVQGETDSFGSELIDMCDECHAAFKKEMADTAAERATGCCDWCKNHATDLRTMRDFEEGSGGPVYQVCGACRQRQLDHLADELDANRGDHYDDYDPSETCQDDGDNEQWLVDDEPLIEGPELPEHVLPPPNHQPRAYVDGRFIY